MQAALHGSAEGARLLEDLLEHEMRKTTLLDLAQAHLQLAHLGRLLDLAQVRDPELLPALDVGDLLLAQIDHLVGVFDDRGGVGADEILVLPHADQQRAALAGGDELVRLALVQDDQRVGADHMVERQGDRIVEGHAAGVHHVLDQLDDDLRIRLALKMIPLPGQLGLEGQVVLDDAVVDQRQFMVLGVMGMRIDVAGLAVRRPAGVGDADAAGSVLVRRHLLQVADLALGLVDRQGAAVPDQRHAGAVITPVLQPGKSLDQDRIGLPAPDISYDTAHIS